MKAEDEYVLYFVESMADLLNDPNKKFNYGILLRFLSAMDKNNVVLADKRFKKSLSETTGMTYRSVQSCIYDLKKADIIKKVDVNEYMVNPKYFASRNYKKNK